MQSAIRPFRITRSLLVPYMAATVLAANLALAAEEPGQEEPADSPDSLFGLGLLDRTRSGATNSANALANRLDRFFGVRQSDIEAAYSALRVAAVGSWNEIDGYEPGIRVRGKVYLPRINERISVIFSDENGDDSSYYAGDDVSVGGEQKTRVNLEFNLAEKNAHHLYFRLGPQSGPTVRAGFRYHYEPDSDSATLNRFTQSVHYQGGDGFGTFSRYQLDHIVSTDSLVRLTNDLRIDERFHGAKYASILEILKRRSDRTAMSWYGRINGETRPGFIVSYDLGFRLRKNISRDWLFLELEPGYTWRKETFNSPREGSPFIVVRLEMAVGSYN